MRWNSSDRECIEVDESSLLKEQSKKEPEPLKKNLTWRKEKKRDANPDHWEDQTQHILKFSIFEDTHKKENENTLSIFCVCVFFFWILIYEQLYTLVETLYSGTQVYARVFCWFRGSATHTINFFAYP